MALNLKKGQKVDLTKKGETLGKLLVGLGWDPVKPEQKGGFFQKLFSAGVPDFDLDASVLMLQDGDKLKLDSDTVYFGKLKSNCMSVIHQGDNLTGEGEGDDEQIKVDLSKTPDQYKKLLFVVNIYSGKSRNQHFGMIKNCYIRIYDETNRKELVRYNISESNDNKTALEVAAVERGPEGWQFKALGEGTNDESLSDIMARYR
ncbi:MAG: TerD family protein [Chitinispirillaceae bacterium]